MAITQHLESKTQTRSETDHAARRQAPASTFAAQRPAGTERVDVLARAGDLLSQPLVIGVVVLDRLPRGLVGALRRVGAPGRLLSGSQAELRLNHVRALRADMPAKTTSAVAVVQGKDGQHELETNDVQLSRRPVRRIAANDFTIRAGVTGVSGRAARP